MVYNTLGIKKSDIEEYKRFQKTIFFTKADIPISDIKLKKSLLHSRFDKDRVHIKTIFQEQFGTSPLTIIPLPRSTLHRVYKVTLPKNSYVVRINALGNLYREFSFLTERRIMECLSNKSFQSIVVHMVNISRKHFPFDYEIMDVAKGHNLFDVAKSKKIHSSILTELGKTIALVHTIKTNKFGPFDVNLVGIYPTWKEYIYCSFDKHIRLCIKIGFIDKEIGSRVRSLFLKFGSMLKDVDPVLLHGDLANHNVFTDEKRITALIDWEDAISGDPIFDIAYFGTGCYLHNEWFDAFLKGYQSRQELPEDFWLRYWLYFIRISLSKAIARYRFGTDNDPSLPPGGERILYGLKRFQLLV